MPLFVIKVISRAVWNTRPGRFRVHTLFYQVDANVVDARLIDIFQWTERARLGYFEKYAPPAKVWGFGSRDLGLGVRAIFVFVVLLLEKPLSLDAVDVQF
jgi:hypothetical protein